MRAAAVIALIAVLASTPACATFDTATEIETSSSDRALRKLYEEITSVTVKVLVMCENEGAIIARHGTGVIIGHKENTYALLTSRHVIDTEGDFPEGAHVYINVEHPKVGNIKARVLATDEECDLACLAFDSPEKLAMAKLVKSEPPLLAEVYHYGFGGLWYKGPFATKGVFSSKSRVWAALPCAWTVTCNVWYGSSGGGVFTASGRLVGITSVIDIERHECLPWLVGVVPFPKIKIFLAAAGFEDTGS